MYLHAILYFMTWPLLIAVSYFIISATIKKVEKEEGNPPEQSKELEE